MSFDRFRVCAPVFIAGMASCVAASAAPLPRAAASTDARRLAAAIDAVVARQSFNGVVLVRRGHAAPIVRSFGIASADPSRPSSATTLYQTGSFSKWVTSVVVLRLVDQGKLALHEPISRYLPEYRADSGARLTLHTLLSHTSGVPNDLAAALGKDASLASLSGLSLSQAVARYASGDLAFAPGSRFDYAHSNWLLVGAIIERVTGLSYRQAVHDLLLAPLRLHGGGIIPADFGTLDGAAAAYDVLVPTPVPTPRERTVPFPDIIAPVGGYYSSAPAMVRLLDAIYDTAFLSDTARAGLWSVNVPEQNYAYGGRVVSIDLGDGRHLVARNNNSNGAYKTLEMRVDDGTTILLFNNTRIDQARLSDMGDALLTAIYPRRPIAPAD